jgi:hypothetical protein
VIVAIGASAGGIQALQSFFGGIPQNTGAAFIVVVHLDPQHCSELSSIVGARTNMPVIQAFAHAARKSDFAAPWLLLININVATARDRYIFKYAQTRRFCL